MNYQPVPDGTYCNESPDGSDTWCIKVTDNGDLISQRDHNDRWTEIGSLTFWGFRLCQELRVSKEVMETLKEGLKWLRNEIYLAEAIDQKEQYARVDAAEAWIKEFLGEKE